MSQILAKLDREKTGKRTREQMLKLRSAPVYEDGRTKQSFKDDTDINKIMARFDRTGTISHMSKYEGVYADFSDFDFQVQTQRLTRGREIFDALPAELRREFGQSPAAFFAYVNDPANAADLAQKLPALAEPGQQLPGEAMPTADKEAALAAASEPLVSETPPAEVIPAEPEKTP